MCARVSQLHESVRMCVLERMYACVCVYVERYFMRALTQHKTVFGEHKN